MNAPVFLGHHESGAPEGLDPLPPAPPPTRAARDSGNQIGWCAVAKSFSNYPPNVWVAFESQGEETCSGKAACQQIQECQQRQYLPCRSHRPKKMLNTQQNLRPPALPPVPVRSPAKGRRKKGVDPEREAKRMRAAEALWLPQARVIWGTCYGSWIVCQAPYLEAREEAKRRAEEERQKLQALREDLRWARQAPNVHVRCKPVRQLKSSTPMEKFRRRARLTKASRPRRGGIVNVWSCLLADVEIKCEGLTHLTSVILNRLISLLRRNVSEGICGHRTMECVEMPEEIDFTKLTVVEIKEELRKRGLKAGQGCFCNWRSSPREVEVF